MTYSSPMSTPPPTFGGNLSCLLLVLSHLLPPFVFQCLFFSLQTSCLQTYKDLFSPKTTKQPPTKTSLHGCGFPFIFLPVSPPAPPLHLTCLFCLRPHHTLRPLSQTSPKTSQLSNASGFSTFVTFGGSQNWTTGPCATAALPLRVPRSQLSPVCSAHCTTNPLTSPLVVPQLSLTSPGPEISVPPWDFGFNSPLSFHL